MPGFSVSALLALLACTTLVSGLELRGARGQAQPSAAPEWPCEDLAKVPLLLTRPLPAWNHTESLRIAAPSFSCHVAASASDVADGSLATCSPVCAESLDIVVVLGVSDWSLEQSDVEESRSSAMDLLKHYDLGRTRGSLFGFLDVSHGARKPLKVSPLSADRKALTAALQAWSPKVGGKAVTNAELQGFEKQPEVLAMLDIARSSVRRTLLVLQAPSRPTGPAARPSHLGLIRLADDPFKRDKEIMELLVSTCPAVRIDPTMKCGRMRWGSAESSGSDKMKPWGDKTK